MLAVEKAARRRDHDGRVPGAARPPRADRRRERRQGRGDARGGRGPAAHVPGVGERRARARRGRADHPRRRRAGTLPREGRRGLTGRGPATSSTAVGPLDGAATTTPAGVEPAARPHGVGGAAGSTCSSARSASSSGWPSPAGRCGSPRSSLPSTPPTTTSRDLSNGNYEAAFDQLCAAEQVDASPAGLARAVAPLRIDEYDVDPFDVNRDGSRATVEVDLNPDTVGDNDKFVRIRLREIDGDWRPCGGRYGFVSGDLPVLASLSDRVAA